MADKAVVAPSSFAPVSVEDQELLLLQQVYGSESGWVEARTHCNHLNSLSSDLTHIPTHNTPCSRFGGWVEAVCIDSGGEGGSGCSIVAISIRLCRC